MDFRKAAWGIASCVVEKFLGERSGAPLASGSRGTAGQVCLSFWDPSASCGWDLGRVLRMGFGSSSHSVPGGVGALGVSEAPLSQQSPPGTVQSPDPQARGCSVGSAGEEEAVRALLAGRLCPSRLP